MTVVHAALHRSRERLAGSPAALEWLQGHGIALAAAELLGLGLEQDAHGGGWISYETQDEAGSTRLSRFPMQEHQHGGESSTSIWSSAPFSGAACVVVDGPIELWLLAQALSGQLAPYVVLTRSVPGIVPLEWRREEFWSRFRSIDILADRGGGCSDVAAAFAEWPWLEPDVALAPTGGWRSHLASLPVAATRTVDDILEIAVPALALAPEDAAMPIARTDAPAVSLRGFDPLGRLHRVIAVEERHVGDRGGSRQSLLVARSDGCVLTVTTVPAPPGSRPSQRVHALSDGTRLVRAPDPGSATGWSLASLEAYAAGRAEQASASMLHAAVAAMLAALFPDPADAGSAALHVVQTYVFPAFDRLPLLVVEGDPVARRLAARLLAALCFSGRVAARARARTLERLADRTGGTLVLDEPGPLLGPGGATEIGRFVIASLMPETSGVHEIDVEGGVRELDVFGPRVVCCTTRPRTDWPEVTHVRAAATTGGAMPPDRDRRALVDRLQTWGLQCAALVREQWLASGQDHVMSWFADFVGLHADARASAPEPPEALPDEMLHASVASCRERAGARICLAHLTLELACRGGTGGEFTPERIGRWLSESGLLDTDAVAERRRLHGQITRIYTLGSGDQVIAAAPDPFAFCTAQPCEACRYDAICGAVLPLLRTGKDRAASRR
ncbi:hypothetical protein [Sphingomonas beigongshangi]|uniref:hypothetical protein n=1 Tax=Sphingomonas beigongshangi TaxID=2782540 RepID=UPI001AEDCA71|nr:hypothetical protein [Sphingomonas beigongshangi]